MKLGFIGLGRMGQAMVLHTLEKGVDVVAYNRTQQKLDELSSKVKNLKLKVKSSGIFSKAYTVEDLVKQLEPPRTIWLMVEHGRPVDDVIDELLSSGIKQNDIVIDGGNSFYKDSIRRYNKLHQKNINYLDIGTSGGLEGARLGACLMIGGDKEVFESLESLFKKLAVDDGYCYFGPAGAGHFVKMVHNGVEYGMLQAIGEGFEILSKAPYKLNLTSIAKNWSHGSVVRGWLMDLLTRALVKDPKLDSTDGVIGGGSTGEWTLDTARELGVDVPVIESSLAARKQSQQKPTFTGKVVAVLRNQFGGHEMKP